MKIDWRTAARPWVRWQRRRALPSSCGQLLCSFAVHVTWYQCEFDLPHLRHSNFSQTLLAGHPLLVRWARCPATSHHPCLLADIHLLHCNPWSAEDNSPWWHLATIFFHFSPLLLRKDDAIYALHLREYAVWTKGPALGSAVKSVSTLQKLTTWLEEVRILLWSKKPMQPQKLINLVGNSRCPMWLLSIAPP